MRQVYEAKVIECYQTSQNRNESCLAYAQKKIKMPQERKSEAVNEYTYSDMYQAAMAKI